MSRALLTKRDVAEQVRFLAHKVKDEAIRRFKRRERDEEMEAAAATLLDVDFSRPKREVVARLRAVFFVLNEEATRRRSARRRDAKFDGFVRDLETILVASSAE